MEDLILAYNQLEVENLPNSWINTIIESGFTEYVEFPEEYELISDSKDLSLKIKNFCASIDEWFASNGTTLSDVLMKQRECIKSRTKSVVNKSTENCDNKDSGDTSEPAEIAEEDHANSVVQEIDEELLSELDKFKWTVLQNEGLESEKLLSLFGTLILRRKTHPDDANVFKLSSLASVAYLYITAIPGSCAFDIFSSELYIHVLDLMNVIFYVLQSDNKHFQSRKRKCNKVDKTSTAGIDEKLITTLSSGKQSVTEYLIKTLSALLNVFKNCGIDYKQDVIELSIRALVNVGKLEQKINLFHTNDINHFGEYSVTSASKKSYDILFQLCRLVNEKPEEIVNLIIKEFCQSFLAIDGDNLASEIPEVRGNIISFISKLLHDFENCSISVTNLVQSLCRYIPDKADLRFKLRPVMHQILSICPINLLRHQIYNIVLLSHYDSVKVRLFATELITSFFTEFRITNMPVLAEFTADDKLSVVFSYEFLLSSLFSRCLDVSLTVKSKAFYCLDKIMERLITCTDNEDLRNLFYKFLRDPYSDVHDPSTVPEYSVPIFNTRQYIILSDEVTTDNDNANNLRLLPGIEIITKMLIWNTRTSNVYVRKYAFLVLEKICVFNQRWMDENCLEVFLSACFDKSVMIRKCVAVILTNLLVTYPMSLIIKWWVKGVLPLALQEEKKHQDTFIHKIIIPIIFDKMAFHNVSKIENMLPWAILMEICAQHKTSILGFVIEKWHENEPISKSKVDTILSHIGTQNDIFAWCILSYFAKLELIVGKAADIVFLKFMEMPSNMDIPQSQYIMETLCFSCTKIDRSSQKILLEKLHDGLSTGTLPFKLIVQAHKICHSLVAHSHKDNELNVYLDWSRPLIQTCQNSIFANINLESGRISNVDTLLKYIVLLGELALQCPADIDAKIGYMLEDVLHSDFIITAEKLKPLIVLTLVKYYIYDEVRVKKLLPKFQILLRLDSISHQTKMNIIIVLCDLCTKYTEVVEPFLIDICMCFNSTNDCLRLTAIESIVSKLSETYIKLKPWFAYPLFTLALDKCVEIRYIINGLLVAESKLIFERFYSYLFYYTNNYTAKGMIKLTSALQSMVTIKDESTRLQLLLLILDKAANLTQRIVVWKKLSLDVINKINNGSLPLNEQTKQILLDAFYVLAKNEIAYHQQTAQFKAGENEDDEDEDEKSTEADSSYTQLYANRVAALSEIVENLLKIRVTIKPYSKLLYDSFLDYVQQLLNNFEETCQEIEPLLNNEDLMIDIRARMT